MLTDGQGRFARLPGLPILGVLVALGMGVPTYYLWAIPRLEARAERIRDEAPSDPEGRVAMWFQFGQPKIHHALVMARFSAEQPWFVTHVVQPNPEGAEPVPPEIWGIDFSDLSPEVAELDGMRVRVILPAPALLDHGVLVGDKAMGVPVFAAGSIPSDPRELARERLERYLDRMRVGIERDIEGARLTVEVGGLR